MGGAALRILLVVGCFFPHLVVGPVTGGLCDSIIITDSAGGVIDGTYTYAGIHEFHRYYNNSGTKFFYDPINSGWGIADTLGALPPNETEALVATTNCVPGIDGADVFSFPSTNRDFTADVTCQAFSDLMQIEFTYPTYTVAEDGGEVEICVEAPYGLGIGDVTFRVQGTDGTAIVGQDYANISVDGTFTNNGPNWETHCMNITIIDDGEQENNETFMVEIIRTGSSAWELGCPHAATVTILSSCCEATECGMSPCGTSCGDCTGSDVCNGQDLCGPAPGSGSGDPIIYGFDGGWFHFMGYPGRIYNLISDSHFQLNSRFVSDDFYHEMTWMGDLGIMICGDTLIFQVNGTKILNGKELVPSLVELTDGGKLTVWEEAIGIEIPNYELYFQLFENPPHFNVHADYTPGPGSSPHGVLGQTSDGVLRYQNPEDVDILRTYLDNAARVCTGLHGSGCIDGEKDDYEIVSGNLLGTDFLFNKFEASRVQFDAVNWEIYKHKRNHTKSVEPGRIVGGTADSQRKPFLRTQV